MKKTLIASLAIAFGMAVSSAGAFAADKTLAERHGGAFPKSENGYVTKAQCMKCHGDYAKLAEKTMMTPMVRSRSAKMLDPNPHFSHLGEVNCEDCHKADKAKPELMCNTCHQFKVRAKAAAK